MANIRIKNAYAPEVAYPFVEQPTLPRDIADPLFNAQKAMGGAVADLGSSISKLGTSLSAKMQAEKSKADQFRSQNAYIDEATQAQVILDKQMNDAPPGADGFTQSTLDFFKQRQDKIVADLNLPPDQAMELSQKFATMRQSIVAKSLTFQDNSYAAKAKTDLATTGDNLGKIVGRDPNELPNALVELRKSVDTLPGPIDAPTRQTIYDEQARLLRLSAGMSLARTDPQGVIGALESGTGDQPGAVSPLPGQHTSQTTKGDFNLEAAKHAISSIESGGRYDIIGKSSRTGDKPYGKYQVMGANVGPWTQQVLGWALTKQEFLASPGAQEAVFTAKFSEYVRKYGSPEKAAQVWFTGSAAPSAKGQTDVLGTSGQEYVDAFNSLYGGKSGPATVSSGNPILDKLTVEEQARVLSTAHTALNQQGVTERSQLAIDTNNFLASTGTGGLYNGPMPTRDRFISAYGQADGEQKWAEMQGEAQQGQFLRDNATASPEQLQQKLVDAKPSPTLADGSANPTYGVQAQAYANLGAAVDKLVTARTQDSAAYAIQYFPDVQKAYEAQAQNGTPAARQQFFAQLSSAYDQLGISQSDRKAFPSSMVTAMQDKWASLTPDQLVKELGGLAHDTGDLFYNALDQLSKSGHAKEAYIAGMMQEYPETAPVLANALRGWNAAYGKDGSTALRPPPSQLDQAMRSSLGMPAITALPPSSRSAIQDLATGLYITNNGAADGVNQGTFDTALNAILGGNADNSVIADLHNGNAPAKTILPPHTTADQFKLARDNFDQEFYQRNSVDGSPPLYADGRPVSPNDIESEGVFVRAGSDSYVIQMGQDGAFLRTDKVDPSRGDFAPYIVTIKPQDVQNYSTPLDINHGAKGDLGGLGGAAGASVNAPVTGTASAARGVSTTPAMEGAPQTVRAPVTGQVPAKSSDKVFTASEVKKKVDDYRAKMIADGARPGPTLDYVVSVFKKSLEGATK